MDKSTNDFDPRVITPEKLQAIRESQEPRTEAEAYAQLEEARKASEALMYLTPLANDPLDW